MKKKIIPTLVWFVPIVRSKSETVILSWKLSHYFWPWRSVKNQVEMETEKYVWENLSENLSKRNQPEQRLLDPLSRKKLNLSSEMLLGYLADNRNEKNYEKIVYSQGTSLDYSGDARKKKPIFAPNWNQTVDEPDELTFKEQVGSLTLCSISWRIVDFYAHL